MIKLYMYAEVISVVSEDNSEIYAEVVCLIVLKFTRLNE